MNTNLTENEARALTELLEQVGTYDDAEKDAFMLLGQVYKAAKQAGYRAGVNAATRESDNNE